MADNHAVVFLMGTAGSSQWREPIKAACAAEGISVFDPIVPSWDEAASRREAEALQHAQVVLMAITSETASVGALAESGWVALSALRRHQALGLYIDPHYTEQAEPTADLQTDAPRTDKRATDTVESASQRARKLVIQHATRLAEQFPELTIYIAKDLADLQAWTIQTAKVAPAARDSAGGAASQRGARRLHSAPSSAAAVHRLCIGQSEYHRRAYRLQRRLRAACRH
jgi:hypothetical protein